LFLTIDEHVRTSVGRVFSNQSIAAEKKKYTGSENHSPHKLRKRSHFGTEYCKAAPLRKGKENRWGSRGLQAWPETGS
jgi:hypothetical protein